MGGSQAVGGRYEQFGALSGDVDFTLVTSAGHLPRRLRLTIPRPGAAGAGRTPRRGVPRGRHHCDRERTDTEELRRLCNVEVTVLETRDRTLYRVRLGDNSLGWTEIEFTTAFMKSSAVDSRSPELSAVR
ncbi:hypothetical protein [Actinomadura keratinilytica]|jgi:hypothetical protein|uniref:Polymerase nucleotidyl transferase domain-containing protein n=2 Tax=Actinomadura keratinilytica TaxID=547461 RepID=A0ABP7YHM8_9ACTN